MRAPEILNPPTAQPGANSMPGLEDSVGLRLVLFLDSPMSGRRRQGYCTSQ
jgi:hypothetical protein